MNIDGTTIVRDIVLGVPSATRVLDAHRIDYCCGGGRSLSEACAQRGADCDRVLAELTAVSGAPREAGSDWSARPLGELVAHIVATHHEPTRAELERLRGPLEKVVKVHGAAHSELAAVKRIFDELEADLGPHMFREERILFPYIERLAKTPASAGAPTAPFGSVANPVRMMTSDHLRDGALLEALRETTKDYALPEGACTTYAVLYDGLRRLDADLRLHIHLENNVLFPRALRVEAQLRGA